LKINKSISLEPRIYDINVKINLTINPELIPVLISQKALQAIQQIDTPQGKIQDPNPYYVTEEIEDIRDPANGVEFILKFWNSYIAVMKERPIGGRKKGHISPLSWETPENDFYTIGGKIEGNKVYLRIYIPPEGFETSNQGLLRDAKAGLLNFSIVSWTEDIIETDENGDIKSITAVRSVKGERNDRVEIGMGAMQQKVNKEKTGDNPDNKIKTEEFIMAENKYSEVIKNLKNQIDNGTVSKKDIAGDLKIEILTEEQKAALKKLKDILTITGENPIDVIKQLKENEQAVKQEKYENTREKLMSKEFGPEKIMENGQEKANLKREAAEPYVSTEIQETEKLEKQIKEAKEKPVVKNISFQVADINSEINDITGVKIKKNSGFRKEIIKA